MAYILCADDNDHSLEIVDSLEKAQTQIKIAHITLIICGGMLGRQHGIELYKLARAQGLQCPFIAYTRATTDTTEMVWSQAKGDPNFHIAYREWEGQQPPDLLRALKYALGLT